MGRLLQPLAGAQGSQAAQNLYVLNPSVEPPPALFAKGRLGAPHLCANCRGPESGVGSSGARLAHLSFREAEAVRQLLPLGAHHVVVLLEGALQPQELRGREGRADPLGLAREGAVQKQPVLGHVARCGRAADGNTAGTDREKGRREPAARPPGRPRKPAKPGPLAPLANALGAPLPSAILDPRPHFSPFPCAAPSLSPLLSPPPTLP